MVVVDNVGSDSVVPRSVCHQIDDKSSRLEAGEESPLYIITNKRQPTDVKVGEAVFYSKQ